ncbi:hypothetical protein RM530_08655 [Algiphilus sp. W345]|uniref:Uncharacterized protein n=1 Tax=Banduia mediterranea TaxID=3075609 RepID=A0ABU2WHT7_9GAMM|nr:hypothetical protein [Algiphilus sp. W345]MDT0497433.1 hypothetical protein [Algiphilus sp. W345]
MAQPTPHTGADGLDGTEDRFGHRRLDDLVRGVLLNLWLVTHYEMARLSLPYILVAAVLQPARRASRVPPMVATREA